MPLTFLLENDDWNMGKASGIPGTSVVIGGMYNTTPMVTSNVLVHEVGHLLNLFHTFHGCEGGGTDCSGNPVPSECLENPNGSNGITCGDFVADTPADPFINNLSVNSIVAVHPKDILLLLRVLHIRFSLILLRRNLPYHSRKLQVKVLRVFISHMNRLEVSLKFLI